MKKLANRADTTIAEVVDIISITNAVCKTVHIVDTCKNIINDNVLWNEVISSAADFLFKFFVIIALAKNFAENSKTNTLFNIAFFFCIEINELGNINHCVRYNLNDFALNMLNESNIYTCIFDFSCKSRRDNLTCLCHNLTCEWVCDRLCNLLICNSICYAKLFVIFITTYS